MRPASAKLLISIFLGALSLLCPRAYGHIVPEGVGSQTWFELRPSGLRVTYNMGFSSLLGYEYISRMDGDKNGRIDAVEKRLFLEQLGRRLTENLTLTVGGKPVTLRLVEQSASGIIGDVERVAFDTFYVFEAALELGEQNHELRYYEGNFPNEVSQQYLWLPGDHEDFRNFRFDQQEPVSAPRRDRGHIRCEGRDLTLRFQFNAAAIKKEQARQLAALHRSALDAVIAGIESSVIRPALDQDLNSLAFSDADFRAVAAGNAAVPPGPSAILATDRSAAETLAAAEATVTATTPSAEGTSASNSAEGEASALFSEDFRDVLRAVNEPFSMVALLTFVFLGAWHARTPGHGKTMVAAYLIGRHGTIWEAVKLGLMVTFTHTVSLYTIGLSAVYIIDELYEPEEFSKQAFLTSATFWITFASGLVLILFAIQLFRRRYARYKQGQILPAGIEGNDAPPAHAHRHAGDAHHHHGDAHHHHGDAHHQHGHGAHDHEHAEHHHPGLDEQAHAAAHAGEYKDISSFWDLMTVAISGGLVPCPMGVLIIIYSLQPQHQDKFLQCLTYLIGFSLGLGFSITALAVLMVLFRDRFASALADRRRRRFLALAPLYSALAIGLVGVALTYEAFDPNFVDLRARVIGPDTTLTPPRLEVRPG
jgi:ABC-type nickel/cobalt efflux system permease component RcnA